MKKKDDNSQVEIISCDFTKCKYKKKPIYQFIKRIIDIVSSFLGIILLSPILLIVALLVKCSSKGPILFKDKRVGRKGKDISVWKYRSMYIDAESRLVEYLTPEQLVEFKRERKIENDPRITKMGKFLRKTSLDELPQLFNILSGKMSIIGGRPLSRMEHENNYTKEEQEVLNKIKPGLSGYWQAYGRSDVTFKSGERQRMDLYYVYHRGGFMDIKILFRTVIVVLLGKGAK